IERLHLINKDDNIFFEQNTQQTNMVWQTELSKRGSVWQFYQLVMTQWSTEPDCDQLCGTPGTTIPGEGPKRLEYSAFSNTTLETWAQTNIKAGCMNCHGIADRDHHDFVWSLRMNAYPRGQSRQMGSSPAVKDLQDLLDLFRKQ